MLYDRRVHYCAFYCAANKQHQIVFPQNFECL